MHMLHATIQSDQKTTTVLLLSFLSAAIQPLAIMVLGRLTHYAFDAVLISAFLAGVKRSTGLTPTSIKSSQLGESKEVQTWVDRYLGVGEWFMDQSIAVMGSSGFFERKR